MSQQPPQGQVSAIAPRPVELVSVLAIDRPLWTRQPEESNKAWAWFCLYRDAHPAARTLQAAYDKYYEARHGTKAPNFAPRNVQNMARRWSWNKRAAEYDAYIDVERNAAVAVAREEALKEVAELGRNMRRAAAIAVQALFKDLYETRIDPDTGEQITVFKTTLTPNAIVRLAKTGVELERLALGMDTMPQGMPSISVQVALATGAAPRDIITTDDDVLTRAAEIIQMHEMQKKVLEGEYTTQPGSPPAKSTGANAAKAKVTVAVRRGKT